MARPSFTMRDVCAVVEHYDAGWRAIASFNVDDAGNSYAEKCARNNIHQRYRVWTRQQTGSRTFTRWQVKEVL